ncbi:MAG: ATP phosphoribosyltransferase [Bacteroidetes bacterium]|nr:MAG: ATP phosphoribosyltransferase [Bacteroidota bacterium]
MIRLAIQKSGRLSDDSLALMRECGISFHQSAGKLKAEASNFPIEFLFLRDDDIPQYVANGTADLGIVGENVLVENNETVDWVEKLGFGKCRLAIAVTRDSAYENVGDLNGMKIATSYPQILRNYLKRHNIKAHIHEISGSVEIAPSIGLAQAICDIVSSGSTLMSNGLKEVETVMQSESVLIATPNLTQSKKNILEQLRFRIQSVRKAQEYKYILMNVPNHAIERVSKILPVLKSPTILPLALEGWSSLHSVVREDEFWRVISQLKEAGAEGILVIPIERMVA